MPTYVKAALIALLVALLGWLGYDVSQQLPAPSPSPSPSVLVSPSPNTSPSVTPSVTSSPVVSLPAPSVSPVAVYQVQTVTTTQPSFIGASVGAYGDILVPQPLTTAPGPGIVIDTQPIPRGFPFYAELQFDQVGNSYSLGQDSSTLAQRAALVQKFMAVLRAHGVEPIKQWVIAQPTDWNQFSAYGASFNQLVVQGAIYPPCVLGPDPSNAPNPTFLKLVEAAILSGTLPAGTWAYVWDEPTAAQHAALVTYLNTIRQYAPHLRTRVTTLPSSDLIGLVDDFAPIFEQYPAGGATNVTGTYGSCTSGGSCTNGVQGKPTGTPIMGAVEAAPINPFVYPIVAAGIGAKWVLYYNTTQSLPTARNAGGEYYAGQNGDGTLLYAGDNFTPWPSMRLLGIKQGLVALSKLSAAKLQTLITSPTNWSKNLADYQ